MKEENKYLNSKASVDAWFNDCIEPCKDGKIAKSSLYDNYKQYCDDSDLTLMKKSELFENIEDLMGTPYKNNVWWYRVAWGVWYGRSDLILVHVSSH